MLLSYNELVELVADGTIINCPLELVNGASVDVTLSEKIYTELHIYNTVDFRKRWPLKMREEIITELHGYRIEPGECRLVLSVRL